MTGWNEHHRMDAYETAPTHCGAEFNHAMHTTPNGICWGVWMSTTGTAPKTSGGAS